MPSVSEAAPGPVGGTSEGVGSGIEVRPDGNMWDDPVDVGGET